MSAGRPSGRVRATPVCAAPSLRTFHRHRFIACVALIGVALSAGTGTQAAEAVSAAYVGTASDIGLYLAERKGYFRAEGLEVTLNQLDVTNKMVPMLGTGDLDV